MYDALIAGAGPAGSTAARLLAQAGWSVLLLEKAAFPRRKTCGEFISATSAPLLADIGTEEDLLRLAGPEVRRVGFFAARVTANADMPKAQSSPALWGRAIRREHLDYALCRAAVTAGAELWQPCRVLSAEPTDFGFAVTAASEDVTRIAQARRMIVATGSWERTGFAAIGAPHRPADLFAFKAHFQGAKLAPDLMPLIIFPGGYAGMVHTSGGAVSLSFCIRRDMLDDCRKAAPGKSAADAAFHRIRKCSRGVRNALGGAELESNWLAAGPIRPGIRRCYDRGLFHIGNAAGEAHPIIAEGISMAMQSAWLLCDTLLQQPAGRAASSEQRDHCGEIYARRWRRAFSLRIRAAAAFAAVAMQPAASAAAGVVSGFPRILEIGARLSGKTNQLVS